MSTFRVFCDGGARGNPGPAAAGVVIYDKQGTEVARLGRALGITTNNVAEYMAVLEAYIYLAKNKLKIESLEFYLDSLLVTQQLRGVYKVKNSSLRDLYEQIKNLEKKVGLPATYINIPRSKNSIADSIVNSVLDGIFNNLTSFEKTSV